MRIKKYKVGDRIFYNNYKGEVESSIILDIEVRDITTDRYGRARKIPVKYNLYKTGACTFIEDYNCLPDNSSRVLEYKKGRTFIAANFRQQLTDWLTAHGARKGDKDVAEILYDLSVEYENK